MFYECQFAVYFASRADCFSCVFPRSTVQNGLKFYLNQTLITNAGLAVHVLAFPGSVRHVLALP